MNSKIKAIFQEYMEKRGFDSESYQSEWETRFERGTEWCYSDSSGRSILHSIAPDIYPKDINAYFVR